MSHPYRPLHAPQLQPHQHSRSHRFREFRPSPGLASHVVTYWTVNFKPVPDNLGHRVIPDGCVDIIVDLLAPSSRQAAYVVGLSTQVEVMQFERPRSVWGIRLYSESARTILKSPLSAIHTSRVFLEELWGQEALSWVERLLAANSDSARIDIAERQLNRILAAAEPPEPSLVYQSMRYIYDSKGNLTVTELAEKVNFSERHLRRAFDRELGVSPKEMLGIVRFQSVLEELHSGDYASLTELALQHGFYDQSHFSGAFMRYYGLPLKRLTRQA
ncbi:AraC family transcriptional regulator [Cohnella sp. GbtcB17]|uniref:helix-turn-helix domain-containing protein n=1 Tax=Cohnella sp. GbtcB17 TaxID=2824762 RepID=UPI0027D33AAE|nr:AraC family transcriptional regulator [Cohnella sp. GbtcB17]